MSALLGKQADDIPDIDLDNLDDLLNALSHEELEELNGDFDPDNSLLPPSQRSRNQTDKEATGPFSRQHLLTFLEKQAKTEKDWEQNKSYVKESKGKKFVAKEQERTTVNEDDTAMETEWDEILVSASEEELVDLAAVLGFHSMLTQTQYYASLRDETVHEGGFTGAAKAQELKLVPDEAPNTTDIEESIKQLKANDPKVKVLNLNNLKNVSIDKLCEVCEALKDNTSCIHFHLAGVAASDRVGKTLAEALAVNKTLKTVNVESNFLSPEIILELVKAVNVNQSVIELRVSNQKPEVLGNKVEMAISKLLQENKTLLRFGVTFEYADARIRTNERLKQNFDDLRKKRVGK
ncbi:hypothetical protein V1264_005021 [Littorina saxatilis]|uniref:Tropomodulin n=2 Tax=Littorina saxatilis TaxID=31220 RepID=A0AAN9AYV2_9CAEN